MLQLSDDAVEALREMGTLRFSIAEAGEDEVELEIEAAEEPSAGDEVVERDGVRVYLDASASGALADQVLEVHPHGDHVHFGFSPQADQG
jgi:Fe-S cluster assembly iron-binding protein IscA